MASESVIPLNFFTQWRDAHFRPAHSFGVYSDPRGCSVVGIARDHYALIALLKGDISIRLGETSKRLQAYEMMLLKPSRKGYEQTTHQANSRLIRFPIEWSPGLAGKGNPLALLPDLSIVPHPHPQRLEEISFALDQSHPQAFDPQHRIRGQAYLMDLLASYVITGFQLGTLNNTTVPNWLDVLCQYIAEHFRDPQLSLIELSDVSGKTIRRIQQAFRLQYNESPIAYIHRVRILHATRLLQANPQTKISFLMQRTGYKNRSQFNRMFKRYTHTTPRSYQHDSHAL